MADNIPKFVYNSTTVSLDYPLVQDNPWIYSAHRTDTFSNSGKQQSSFDYTEETKLVDLQFLSSSLKDSLITMFNSWAAYGYELDFYPDKTSGTFYTVTIVDKKFDVMRQTKVSNLWKVNFTIRKVV
jgi:hypothetical protein